MKRRVFMGLGAASIGAGALYRTGAFSSVSAGRGVAVNAADDPHGLLGIDDSNTTIPTFSNNSSFFMNVELRAVDADADITFKREDTGEESGSPFHFKLAENDDPVSVEIEAEESTSREVEITANLYESELEFDTGASQKGQIRLRDEFTPSIAESINFTGDAEERGGSRTFIFELRNTGNVPITITGFSINRTEGGNWDRVTDGLFTDDGTKLVDGPIEIGDSIKSVEDNLDDENTIGYEDGSNVVTWELDKFEEDDRRGPPADVTGFEGIFEFKANGKSDERPIGICVDSCNFED